MKCFQVNNLTKIERTSIHQFIRTNFENLESRTKEKDGVCQIIVSRKNNKSNRQFILVVS